MGLGDTMAFTYRNPARSTDPSRVLAGARSMVVAAWRYPAASPVAPPGPHARVAHYATTDHYAALRCALERVAGVLKEHGWRTVVLSDDNSVVDREAAFRAGLGWYGKNANILLPEQGSWFVLGSVVTDAPLDRTGAPVPDGCGTCRRCLDGCPTAAIVAPGVVDARRCLSWLLQRPGEFPVEHRVALGDRIYGCDDCQEVCPPNRRGHDPRGPDASGSDGRWLDVRALLELDDAALLERCDAWYIPDRDVSTVRRNLLIVLGNTARPGDVRAERLLDDAASGADPVLASHAAWARAQVARRGRDEQTGPS